MENVILGNVDIVEEDEEEGMYEGWMRVDWGDRKGVGNVLLEEIGVEKIEEGGVLYVKVGLNGK